MGAILSRRKSRLRDGFVTFLPPSRAAVDSAPPTSYDVPCEPAVDRRAGRGTRTGRAAAGVELRARRRGREADGPGPVVAGDDLPARHAPHRDDLRRHPLLLAALARALPV